MSRNDRTSDGASVEAKAYDVLAVLPYYWPETTGHCQSVNSLLPFLVAKGLRVAVMTSNRLYSGSGMLAPFERHEGVDILRTWTPSVSRSTLAGSFIHAACLSAAAMKAFIGAKARSLFCITSPPFLFAFLAAVKRQDAVLGLWAMDIYPDVLSACGLLRAGGYAERMLARLARHGYRKCDVIFALGPVMAGRLVRNGACAELIRIVHNWTAENIRFVPRDRNMLCREWGLEGRFVVHCSGNMGPMHSFDTLLRTAALMKDSHPDVVFLLIGDGPQKKRIARRVSEEGLRNVRLLNYVPEARLAESLSLADLAVVEIRRGLEGVIAPGKVYGYLKCGTPLAVAQDAMSDTGKLIEDGAQGILLKVGDAGGLRDYICRLRNDEALRHAIRQVNAAWYETNSGLVRSGGAIAETWLNLLGKMRPGRSHDGQRKHE